MKLNLNITNSELIAGCMSGNQDTLNTFYLRFAPKMLGVIHRYIRNNSDAEDILHDGFLIAFTRLNTIKNPDSIESWLASIMRNLCLQFLQSQDINLILNELPEIEDTPEFDEIIELDILERLINKMPPGYQKVFRLAILENKSHSEISKIMGIAPHSSSSQLFHAKQMMRKLITEYRKESGLIVFLLLCSGGFVFLKQNNDVPPIIYNKNPTTTPIHSSIISNNEAKKGKNSVLIKNSVLNNKSGRALTPLKHEEVYPELNSLTPQTSITPMDSITVQKQIVRSDLNNDTITQNTDLNIRDNTFLSKLELNNKNSKSTPGWSINTSIGIGCLRIINDPMSDASDVINPEDPSDNISDRGSGLHKKHKYDNVTHSNDIPLSFSLILKKSLSKHFSLESGICYTYLHTTFHSYSVTSEASWHYVGIPVRVSANIYQSKKIYSYASLGCNFDIPVFSSAHITSETQSNQVPNGKFSSSVVWSLTASYGIGYNFTSKFGIFIEPSLHYHFDHSFNVPNTWTDNKWSFSIPVGFNINF